MRAMVYIVVPAVLAFLAACGGGGVTMAPPPPPPPPPPPQQAPPPIMLRTLYRLNVNGTDRMTSFGSGERSVYPVDAQLYYVPDATASGLTTLTRFVNAGGTDHADSVGPLNGYSLDEVLGYPWSNSAPGLVQIPEGFNSATGDHAMMLPSENLAGYVPQALPVYGYPRYGSQGEVLMDLTAGGITVESNAVAGGSVWRWTWNGMQFINNADYGRQIQNAFYYLDPTGNLNNFNPNEAGDLYHRDNPATAHGSPLLRFENNGNTQSTRTIPLNWDPTVFGGDPDHPIIWNQIVLGKDVTLNFNNMGSVARYTTHLTLPTAAPGGLAEPAIYLRANFNRFWVYDAPSKTLGEVTASVPSGCNTGNEYIFYTQAGGTIISDPSTNFAMGVYAVDEAHGGAASFFIIGNFICAGYGTAEDSGDCVTMNPVKGGGDGKPRNINFPAGESTYNAYIITDTVQNVAAQMDRLYTMGVK
jgi:hypothetical protein